MENYELEQLIKDLFDILEIDMKSIDIIDKLKIEQLVRDFDDEVFQCIEKERDEIYNEGYEDGKEESESSYDEGYDDGYNEGYRQAKEELGE